jgi:hypothetical protein
MILKNIPQSKRQIRLSSPDGNAFILMGLAGNLAKQFEMDKKNIISEMQNGDYKNLVFVFNKYFGESVDIIDDIDLFD